MKQSPRFDAPKTSSKKIDVSENSSKEINTSETSLKECSSNHKANFNHECLRINDSHLDKSINMPVSSSVTETSSSSSSNLDHKTSNLN